MRAILLLLPAAAAAEPLADYVVEDAASIPAPLAPASGAGDRLFAEHCAGCHESGRAPGPAPDLTDVSARLTEGEIRLMIVEPRIALPGTEMPAFYAPGRFGEAPEPMVGRTLLSAGEIEAIVAFLAAPSTP